MKKNAVLRALAIMLVSQTLTGLALTQEVSVMSESIGAARMRADGIIELQLKAENGSAVGDALLLIKPSDPRYEEIKQHVGGLKPGEEKPVPPWKEKTTKKSE